jgi:hypothetical protein
MHDVCEQQEIGGDGDNKKHDQHDRENARLLVRPTLHLIEDHQFFFAFSFSSVRPPTEAAGRTQRTTAYVRYTNEHAPKTRRNSSLMTPPAKDAKLLRLKVSVP